MPSFLGTANADHSYNVHVTTDGLSAEWTGAGIGAVRSGRSIAAHQGVFYFEGQALGHFSSFQMGLAIGGADLSGGGAGTIRVGVDTGGAGSVFESGGGQQGIASSSDTYGFVLDYRGDHPTVYVIGTHGSGTALLDTRTLSDVSDPLFVHLSGIRRMQGKQVTLNLGNDTTNFPFAYDPGSVVPGDVAGALVLGWGATHAGAFDAAPTVMCTPAGATTINLGQSVTLNATSSDAEDGAPAIHWDVLSVSASMLTGTGTSFLTTPSAPGKHAIRCSVVDSVGKTASNTVTITVNGSVTQHSEVHLELENGLSGDGIELDSAGLRAKWHVNNKNGVRANQALAPGAGFWYFEGHRLTDMEQNQGVGLVIGGVSLNPYPFDNAPPSCSVNTVGPGVWQDLISVEQMSGGTITNYGFAVDYRGDTPTVYVIMNDSVVQTLHLSDASVPIYPMLYGNTTSETGKAYDMEINFGPSFDEDVSGALAGAGVSTSGLRQCWGAGNNGACP